MMSTPLTGDNPPMKASEASRTLLATVRCISRLQPDNIVILRVLTKGNIVSAFQSEHRVIHRL